MSNRYVFDSIISDFVILDEKNSGPRLKHDGAGALEIRDTADSAYAITRGADAVGDDDYLTKRQAGAGIQVWCNALPGGVLGDGTHNVDSASAIPATNEIFRAIARIDVAYDDATATISLGGTTDPTLFMLTTENDTQTIDDYIKDQITASPAEVFRAQLIQSGGTGTVGDGFGYIWHVDPLNAS